VLGQRLTEAVQAALYELIQAGGAGAGGRAGALQGPGDVLRTRTCVPPPLDQLPALSIGLPERERESDRQYKKPITSRAECGEVSCRSAFEETQLSHFR